MAFPKNNIPWNKGITGKKLSKETISRMIQSRTGKPLSEQRKKNISISLCGRTLSEDHKQKISQAMKSLHRVPLTCFKKGNKPTSVDKHWKWRGGITNQNHKIRNTLEYKLWRQSVFRRDNYRCIWCGGHKGRIHADHIKPFAQYPELRFAIDNGRTLCESCHKKRHNRGDDGSI